MSRTVAALSVAALLGSAALASSDAAPIAWKVPGSAPAGAPTAPTAPGPAPRHRAFDAVAVNAQCEGCHADIAREWRGSLHRQSHTDPMYVSQFAKEPLPFCTGCHAPEADPDAPVPAALSHLGVGCVTCHVVGGTILAATNAPAGAKPSPHAVSRTGALESPEACGHCHEFAFPEFVGRKDPLLMQSTMSEHAASPLSRETCASCHMPSVETPGRTRGRTQGRKHRSHAFAASRDADLVRSAIRIEEEAGDGALLLTLRPDRVGHAFPTGDLLRRLRLVLDVRDVAGESVEHVEQLFTKRIGTTKVPHGVPKKILAGDDRIGVTTSPVVFRFEPRLRPPGATIHYTLRYERVGDPGGGPGGTARVDGSISLADRTLPLPLPRTTARGASAK